MCRAHLSRLSLRHRLHFFKHIALRELASSRQRSWKLRTPFPFSVDLVFVNPYLYMRELVYEPNEYLHLWKTDSWSQYGSYLPVYHGAGRSLLKKGGQWYHSLSSDWQCRIHTTIMKGQDILIVSCTLNQWKEINHPFYQKEVRMLGVGKGISKDPNDS